MRPNREQMKTALDAAERMHLHGVDPHHLSAALRYLKGRNKSLEELLVMVDHFVRYGMPEPELTQIRLLVDQLRQEEAHDAAAQEEDSGAEIDSSMLL